MKKNHFIILLWIGTIACNKYENGPGFTLRTKINRLTGVWVAKHQILWNGYLPSIGLKGPALIPFNPGDTLSEITIYQNKVFSCKNFKRFGASPKIHQQIPNFEWCSGYGRWDFLCGLWDNQETIEYLNNKEGLKLAFQDGKTITTKISKLTKDEFWLLITWEMGPAKMATILYKWEKKEKIN